MSPFTRAFPRQGRLPRVVASLYLTSAEGRTGKSAVALGVIDAMHVNAAQVGVFRPLIRSRSDRGQVVVLDPRIRTARYGKLFLDALPEGVRIEEVRGGGEEW